MTGPESYVIAEGPGGKPGFQLDERCGDCRAGKLGARFVVVIEPGEGGVELSCAACGGLPDLIAGMDPVYFDMPPIPVTVAEYHECAHPGQIHESGYCDHGSGITIILRTGDGPC